MTQRKKDPRPTLKRPFREWTLREMRLLERHYGRMPIPLLQTRYFPHRTEVAIQTRATLLKITQPRSKYWTSEEDHLLRKHYLTLSSRQLQARYFPYRTVVAVAIRLQRLDLLKVPSRAWTLEELDAVWKNFMLPGGLKSLSRQLQRSEKVIDSKARALGLWRKRDDRWPKKDDALLRRLYPTHGSKARIPGRSETAIAARARKIGIRKKDTKPGWSKAEYQILRKNRHRRTHDLLALLPNRSHHAINIRRYREGLMYKGTVGDGYTGVRWTEAEKNLLLQHPEKTTRELVALLPNHTFGAIKAMGTRIRKASTSGTRKKAT